MDASYRGIGELIARVRARWRRLVFLRAALVAALAVAGVLAAGLVLASASGRSANALAAVGVVTAVVALAVAIRALRPARRVPSDLQVARFIEEHEPSLDDRLVSAVDVNGPSSPSGPPLLARAMLADAERRAVQVEPTAIVATQLLRRAGVQAAAAAVVLVAVGFAGRQTVRRSYDALSLSLFPARVQLEVSPGHARLQAGSPLTIEARLAGNTAPIAAELQRADGGEWIATDMPVDATGTFRMTFDALGEGFQYRVVAGALTSETFDVAVVRPPRVTRVDVEYRYPAALGLPPRTEEDTGDIYAPAGTDVRLIVHTDREAATGQMALGGGRSLALSAAAPTRLEASLRVDGDDSYRLRVADREGMSTPGETEYFIRMLNDRPPDVRVLRPARDRSVTALEEIDIEAEAQDDFGVSALELVYTVRGSGEKVVPFAIPARGTTVSGFHTLYLEDLKVKAGDFISYYVRARDLPRGRRSSEARSDMFFLEVKPYEQEFSLAQSQGGGGGSGSPQIDDLVNAQKEIIVATWKLDRRALASGASSAADIRAVGKAEAELKMRVEQIASQFRDSTMRDPRRRGPAPPGAPRAGQTLPEEDAMTAASKAMSEAVAALEALKTKPAMPAELAALNHLLKAQATVKERQVTRQSGAGGAGQNRQTQDLSSLFDKELARQQQTNYETPNSAEEKEETTEDSMLDKIRELAKRQDELLRKQQELAKQQLSAEEMKRALETLTREQQQLRQQAEQMARQMSRGAPSDPGQQSQSGQKSPAGQRQGEQNQQSQSGQQQSGGQQSQGQQQAGRAGQSGQPSQSGESRPGSNQGRGGDRGSRMQQVSEEMRNAASELSRQDATSASARGNRALDGLRELEQQMRATAPNEQRRAIGDMQLEARQLADAQRQLASELGKVGQGEPGRDALRRLAGEQERLADRAERLEESLERQAQGAQTPPQERQPGGGRSGAAGAEQAAGARQAVGDAAADMQRQRLAERMQQSAEQLRGAAGPPGRPARADGGDRPGQTSPDPPDTRSPQQAARAAAGGQGEIAESLDRLADRLSAANGPSDDQSRRMNDQLARAQELREQMDRLSRELEKLGQQGGPQGTQAGGSRPGRAADGASPSPSERESTSQQGGGQAGEGRAEGTGAGGEAERLRQEYARQLKAAQVLLGELKRDDKATGQGGTGFTFEGQGMVLSAPGTQAFKQDFARWEELRRQATLALEQAESNISKQLQAQAARDRLAAGIEDRTPAGYSERVDSYFKALAGKKGR